MNAVHSSSLLHWREWFKELGCYVVQARLWLLLQGILWPCTTNQASLKYQLQHRGAGKGSVPLFSFQPPPVLQYLIRGITWVCCDKGLEKQRRHVLRCWTLSVPQTCLKIATLRSLESAQFCHETFGSIVSLMNPSILQVSNVAPSWPAWPVFPGKCCKSLSLFWLKGYTAGRHWKIVQHLHGASPLLCGMWPC